MLDPDNDFDYGNEWNQAEEMVSEACELYENGQMQQALEKLDVAIRKGPEHGEWYFNMALTLDGLAQYEKAIEFYKKALECMPDDVEIINCLGVNYTRTAQYDLALSVFEQIEKIDPMFEPAYCNRIIAHTEMERYEKAEQMFYMAQQINPDCPLCYYNIGNSLFTQAEYERAIWCWDKCAELDPGHPQIHYRLAQACWVSGQGKRAREEFLIELRKNPANLDIILDFGLFLLESGDLEAASEKFNRILEFDETFAPAHFYLGEILRLRQQYPQAARCYVNAMKYGEELVGPRFRLAEIEFTEGSSMRGVLQLLRDEFQLGVEDADVLASMGWMFLRGGQITDASNCFMQALNEAEINDEAFFGLGMSLAVYGDYDGAIECVEQAICLEPDKAELQLCAGWINYQLGQWDQAAEHVRKCRQIHPDQEPYRGRSRELMRVIRCGKFLESAHRLFGRIFPSKC
ncbi:MAG: tetratricopeptide repeat protein [Planctomycetota bacterium]